MQLIVCSVCHQNYYATDQSCPHCPSKPSGASLPLGLLLGVGLISCVPVKDLYGVEVVEMDMDEDGFPEEVDCHDQDSSTYPGAAVQDSSEACMTDADGDGFGDDTPEPEDMNIVSGTDCDDSNPEIYPGATESPDDGIDSNCNGNDND